MGKISGSSTPSANGVNATTSKTSKDSTPIQQTNPIPTTHPTDSYIPMYLKNLLPELNAYEELLYAEKKLDIYLSKKKIDLYQNLSQWNNPTTSNGQFRANAVSQAKYLRIFVSNISENQPWMDPDYMDNESTRLNMDTPEALNPQGSWTMRIEGRLLNDQGALDASRPKFSSFIQDIAVDFKKTERQLEEEQEQQRKQLGTTSNGTTTVPLQMPQGQQPNTNTNSAINDVVEWHFDPKNPVDFDGLDIKRQGCENIECTITIQPKGSTAEILKYSPQLTSIIGLSRGSLHEAIYSIYKYVLINDLLMDDEFKTNNRLHNNGNDSKVDSKQNSNGEKTIIKVDEILATLFPVEERQTSIKLGELAKLITTHISPIPPIKVDYTIRVDKASTYGECVFDIEVMDPNTGSSNNTELDESRKEIVTLLSDLDRTHNELKPAFHEFDRQLTTLQLELNSTANKYQFFNELSKDPVPFLKEYFQSSSNAMKVLSGDEGFNEDTVRRAQFYKDNESMLFENLGVLMANGRM